MNRTSVWEKPSDLIDRADVEKMVNNPPAEVSTKTKAEEASKEEPAAKKLRTETTNISTNNVTNNMGQIVTTTVGGMINTNSVTITNTLAPLSVSCSFNGLLFISIEILLY